MALEIRAGSTGAYDRGAVLHAGVNTSADVSGAALVNADRRGGTRDSVAIRDARNDFCRCFGDVLQSAATPGIKSGGLQFIAIAFYHLGVEQIIHLILK